MRPRPLKETALVPYQGYAPVLESERVAPWAPLPLSETREVLLEHPEMQLEIGFPEVFEEDRTAMLTDLQNAHAAKVITHKMMAEKSAQELDLDNYNYDQMQQELTKEQDNPLLTPPTPGEGDPLASLLGGQPPAGGGGGPRPPGGLPAKPPGGGPGVQKPQFPPGGAPRAATIKPKMPVPGTPKRTALSNDSSVAFRKQQRT